MSVNTFNLYTGLLIVGLVSACSSDSDNTSPANTPEGVVSDSSSSDDTANGSTEETAVESELVDPAETDPIDTENGEIDEGTTQDTTNDSSESSTEISLANPQDDDEQANADSQQEQTDPEAEASDNEPPIADNQRVSFGAAKLLVDLEPNGDTYPAKFQLVDDKLYFWTVDTDPRFARCSSHWGALGDEDKSIAFNLVAAHPETGVVSMNKQLITLGDFAEDPNYTCAGYNGSIMQSFEHHWRTPQSANAEQQFVLQFQTNNGPDQLWTTDGSDSNTNKLWTSPRSLTWWERENENNIPVLDEYWVYEKTILEGEKVFFISPDGLWISDTFTGDKRKLFDIGRDSIRIRHVERSPTRQATFEIKVGENRSQIWTYDLDTDEWQKKFNLKPDNNTYYHNETMQVQGETLLSWGTDKVTNEQVLALSRNSGDVTSFEVLTDSTSAVSYAGYATIQYSANENSDYEFTYTTVEFSADSQLQTLSIWGYREERIEKIFSFSEPDLDDNKVIAGHNGLFYITGTKTINGWPETKLSLELWSYDPQTEQLVKLSNDTWYAVLHDRLTPDEGYVFRYLNTPDGLAFLNLKEDSGRELWFTDGTPEGTRQLADINPGAGNSDPQSFYHSGDAIYFSADDGTHGREPWMIPISR